MSTVVAETETPEFAREAPPLLARLSARERLKVGLQIAWLRFKEYLQFDAHWLHSLLAPFVWIVAALLVRIGQMRRGFGLMATLHRGAYSKRTTKWTEEFVRESIAANDPNWISMLDDYIASASPTPGTANFFQDPRRMLGTAVLVLKSPVDGQKGVVVVWYNHVFPLFAKFFDLKRITEKYHLLLESSWSGYCDLNLLDYTRLPAPVFVQAIEPYDIQFLESISANLVPVPVAANWWVDHRRMRPLPDVVKDHDIVMMAGWGSYKRHHRFFAALSQLRKQGHRLRVMLLGYSVGWSRSVIESQADFYGIHDQLTIQERVPYEAVNEQLNRAKVSILWSRREGFNRAVVESLFAGLPCVMRAGFNYGDHYPYLNEATGRFATEDSLPRVLLQMVGDYDNYSPRPWVMRNMSCELATHEIERTIAATLGDSPSSWQGQLAVRINELHSMQYFDPGTRDRFHEDYLFLAATRIPNSTTAQRK